MNEDNPHAYSAPASHDAVPPIQTAEVAGASAAETAADTTATATAARTPATPVREHQAQGRHLQGHEVPSMFTSRAPAAPVIAPVASGTGGAATAPGAAFGIPTATPHLQPTSPTQPTQPTSATEPLGMRRLRGDDTRAKGQSSRGGTKFAAFIIAAALVGGVAGFGGGALLTSLQEQPASGTASGPQTVTVNNPGSVNETAAVATSALPSVVTIEVAGTAQGGSGSGVIVTDDGYVLTNTHVVTLGGAVADPAIRVSTSDGRLYEASVVGLDPIYDLAVIKLEDAKGLAPMTFAESSKLNVGDTTVALGAPLGLANSVTTGIVSALNRSIQIASAALPDSLPDDAPEEQSPGQGQGPFQFDMPGSTGPQSNESISIAVIQTDAAINHGNSGGALVNSKGELIGINVAIASSGSSEESGSIGIGFAIPSDIAKRVSDEIIANGVATHGLLGASVQDASRIEGATAAGAYIAKTSNGGAAAAGGIKPGDVVTLFNGIPITNATDLTAQVRAAAAGSAATLTYARGGKEYDIEVTLGDLAG